MAHGWIKSRFFRAGSVIATALESGTSSYFWNAGGTTSGNTHGSWATLGPALEADPARIKIVQVVDDIANADITAKADGTGWDIDGLVWLGLNDPNVRNDGGGWFTTLPLVTFNVTFQARGATSMFVLDGTNDNQRDHLFFNSQFAGFTQPCINQTAGFTHTCHVYDTSFDASGDEAVNTNVSNGFRLRLYSNSNFDTDGLSGTATTLTFLKDAGSFIGTTQTSHTGTLNIVLVDTSDGVGYTPAVGANWADPDPTTLAEAIDRLAAHVVTSHGAIPV